MGKEIQLNVPVTHRKYGSQAQMKVVSPHMTSPDLIPFLLFFLFPFPPPWR